MKQQLHLEKGINSIRDTALYLTLAISFFSSNIISYGQGNNFFGTSPGSPMGTGPSSSSTSTDYSKDLPEDSNPNAVLPGLNSTNPNTNAMGTDFSGDEKRLQKKYKANLNSAKRLIEKGEGMMAGARKNVNDPNYKKGKIFKETGEKWLVQLKSNNPFPDQSPAK